jgi:RNA 3'-terminal phosphate cyclase (ATP)
MHVLLYSHRYRAVSYTECPKLQSNPLEIVPAAKIWLEMSINKQVELDGRTLEGGGQLLRLAIGLSALNSVSIKITNIRGNRSAGGGLKAQHLACVEWLAHASNATVSGAEKGSKSLDFTPGRLGSASPAYRLVKDTTTGFMFWECKLDIKTAGSTGLALQAILPFILFNPPKNDDGTLSIIPIRLTISGGTNVSGSPSYEYISQVLLPTLHSIGLPPIIGSLNKRGWSHGGSSIGSFTLEIPARQSLVLRPFHLAPDTVTTTPNRPERLDVTFVAPKNAHLHLRNIIPSTIASYFGPGFSKPNDNFSLTCEDSQHDKRYYLIIVATVPSSSAEKAAPRNYKLGRDWLYDRKVRYQEQTTTELADRVTRDVHAECSSGAYVDEHMRDQLVVFQAFAGGRSRVFGGCTPTGESREASLHAKTARWVVEQMQTDIESVK